MAAIALPCARLEPLPLRQDEQSCPRTLWHGFKVGFIRAVSYLGLPNIIAKVAFGIFRKLGLLATAAYNPTFFMAVIAAPVIEEILFRGILQPVIKKVAELILRCFAHQRPEEERLQTAAKVACIVGSFFFGLTHMINAALTGFQAAVIQSVANVFISYFTYSSLREEYGLSASIGAHAGHNFAIWSLITLVV